MDNAYENLPPDWEETVLPRLFEEIHQKLTPDFTTEDWLALHKRANLGDMYSAEMLLSLWKEKVYPHLKPEFQIIDGTPFI